jgi:DeoR/GlpR family transcriptional regulator of sugar metabolism
MYTRYLKNGKHYIGVADFAERLRVSEETIRRRLRRGQIKGAILEKGTWMIPRYYADRTTS